MTPPAKTLRGQTKIIFGGQRNTVSGGHTRAIFPVGMDDSLREALPRESVIIAALLHDVCKADIYKPSVKNRKNAYGIWESVPCYNVVYDNFPLGHGEKSVIMLLRWGLNLTDDEIMAIRWHMNAWDISFQSPDAKGNYNAAKTQCPLVTLIQAADGLSAGILESTSQNEN